MATASERKIASNRANAKSSTGPRSAEGKAKSRMNALKHGLRAEQIVLPGEDPKAFEAEQSAWAADWQPRSHTRAILVERAAITSWRLRRCVRLEGTRLQRIAAESMAKYDRVIAERIDEQFKRLRDEPEDAVENLRATAPGIDALITAWQELAESAAEPEGWNNVKEHHELMLRLMGWNPWSEFADAGPLAVTSYRLYLTNHPEVVEPDFDRFRPAEATQAAAEVAAYCQESIDWLEGQRENCPDPELARMQFLDEQALDLTYGGKELQRYEATLDRSLRATINQLIQLEKTGADLTEEMIEIEVTPIVLPAPNEPKPPAPAEPPAPNEPTETAPRAIERDREGRVWAVEGVSDRLVEGVASEIDQS